MWVLKYESGIYVLREWSLTENECVCAGGGGAVLSELTHEKGGFGAKHNKNIFFFKEDLFELHRSKKWSVQELPRPWHIPYCPVPIWEYHPLPLHHTGLSPCNSSAFVTESKRKRKIFLDIKPIFKIFAAQITTNLDLNLDIGKQVLARYGLPALSGEI